MIIFPKGIEGVLVGQHFFSTQPQNFVSYLNCASNLWDPLKFVTFVSHAWQIYHLSGKFLSTKHIQALVRLNIFLSHLFPCFHQGRKFFLAIFEIKE